MAIIYTYPATGSVNVDDSFLISKSDQDDLTMNVNVGTVFDLIPAILDLDDFLLYDKPFGDPGTIPQPGDTISYNGTDWVPGPPGTVKTEVIDVTASYTVTIYIATVAGISNLEQDVVYKTIFDVPNPISPVTLDINSYGAKSIQRGGLTGLEDIPIDF